jgi:hypothetical protein
MKAPGRLRVKRDKRLLSRDTQRDTPQDVGKVGAAKPRDDVSIKSVLTDLLQNPANSPVLRASAARTLAEMDGLVGRHQAVPDRGQDTPVEHLSRADLVLELGRLRALCAVDRSTITS